MILDNIRIHHAKLLKPFLDENKDRLELMFLPAHSPVYNKKSANLCTLLFTLFPTWANKLYSQPEQN